MAFYEGMSAIHIEHISHTATYKLDVIQMRCYEGMSTIQIESRKYTGTHKLEEFYRKCQQFKKRLGGGQLLTAWMRFHRAHQ